MLHIRAHALLMALTALAAGAALAVTPAFAADPTATPASSPTITRDDNGRTLNLAIGDTFLLKLGSDFDWDVRSSNLDVVARVPNISVIAGAQGVYAAKAAGNADLSATGTVHCAAGTPCPQLVATFQLHVVVGGSGGTPTATVAPTLTATPPPATATPSRPPATATAAPTLTAVPGPPNTGSGSGGDGGPLVPALVAGAALAAGGAGAVAWRRRR